MGLWQKSRLLRPLVLSALTLVSNAYAIDFDPSRTIDGDILAKKIVRHIRESGFRDPLQRKNSLNGLYNALYFGEAVKNHSPPTWEKLSRYVLSQPFQSISPSDFFRTCLDLEEGNVQNGLVLAWDFLSAHWNDEIHARNLRIYALKFKDITGELKTLMGGVLSGTKKVSIRGDNFSAWYHFFGTSLAAYVEKNTALYPLTKNVPTNTLIWAEEKFLFGDAFVDPKKRIHIDKQGMEFGYKLNEYLRKFRSTKEIDSKFKGVAYASEIIQNKKLFGEAWRLKENQLAVDYLTDSERVTEKYFMEAPLRWVSELNDLKHSNTPIAEVKSAWIKNKVEELEWLAKTAFADRAYENSISSLRVLLKDIEIYVTISWGKSLPENLNLEEIPFGSEIIPHLRESHTNFCASLILPFLEFRR